MGIPYGSTYLHAPPRDIILLPRPAPVTETTIKITSNSVKDCLIDGTYRVNDVGIEGISTLHPNIPSALPTI